MKYELPECHGLSPHIIESLVHKDDGMYSLTDIQFDSLNYGVGRGNSLLVVSPTSTGKTQIAMWALAAGIDAGCRAVYLVTHRALAKQKFNDFKDQIVPMFYDGDNTSLTIATGDYVEDGEGNYCSDPLNSPILIATYEKYLALLSASGIPSDMSSTIVICDEIQLIGDANRGRNVEVLLTLLRKSGLKQFVGLSAVLIEEDAKDLASWLGVELLISQNREKHLNYECWTDEGRIVVNTRTPDLQESVPYPPGLVSDNNVLSVINSLFSEENPPVPIIVFCMKKSDTYDLAKAFTSSRLGSRVPQMSLAFEELPETGANQILSETIDYGIGSHSADLTDDEREIVESRLLNKEINVVFATSTLAAGVNFPFGAAVFVDWKRWNGQRHGYVPIDPAEFHNMSGRVGRMGFDHESGRVIFLAKTSIDKRSASQYLRFNELPDIKSRIDHKQFEQLSLQLVASGLCHSKQGLIDLICSTLSGLREEDNNTEQFKLWPNYIEAAVTDLCQKGLLILAGEEQLSALPLGRAIAYSGLLPDTGVSLLRYLIRVASTLVECIPSHESSGNMDKFAYLLFSACYASPEFKSLNGKPATRYLPYQIEKITLFDPTDYSGSLYDEQWRTDRPAINAADLSLKWILGYELKDIEGLVDGLSAGALRDMYRNLVWLLKGMSSIVEAAIDDESLIADYFDVNTDDLEQLRKLPRTIQRLGYRVHEGLPDEVVWMKSLTEFSVSSEFKLTRHEIIAFYSSGYTSPDQLSLGAAEAEAVRFTALKRVKPSPHRKANWLRDTCRIWKENQRRTVALEHIKKAKKYSLEDYFKEYYDQKGNAFETAFEELLVALGVPFEKLDDNTKTGAPDYSLIIDGKAPVIVELKSKQGDKLVDYNGATEVLAASEIHGYAGAFCITLCHPGVDPSVPNVIVPCGRLCVVESHDLGEALLRIGMNTLTQHQLWQWLTTPGQALTENIPYKTPFVGA